jgi:hypothetical protein
LDTHGMWLWWCSKSSIVLPEILIIFFTTSNLELLRDKNHASGGEAAKGYERAASRAILGCREQRRKAPARAQHRKSPACVTRLSPAPCQRLHT